MVHEFHYKYIETKYDNRAKLLFIDIDSLVHQIERADVHEEFYGKKNLFDLSDYEKDSKNFYLVNKKVIGKMKSKGKKNREFIGLKSKMYGFIVVVSEEI